MPRHGTPLLRVLRSFRPGQCRMPFFAPPVRTVGDASESALTHRKGMCCHGCKCVQRACSRLSHCEGGEQSSLNVGIMMARGDSDDAAAQ
eukprot:1388705-Rhodomonas_salina.1